MDSLLSVVHLFLYASDCLQYFQFSDSLLPRLSFPRLVYLSLNCVHRVKYEVNETNLNNLALQHGGFHKKLSFVHYLSSIYFHFDIEV